MVDLAAIFERAAAQSARGDFESAIADYRTVIQLSDGRDFWGWNNLGQNLMQLRRYDEAADAFRSAAALESDFADVWLSLAHALSAKGDAGGSRKAFYRCLSIDLAAAADRRGLGAFVEPFMGAGNYWPDLNPHTLAPRCPGMFIVTLPKSGTMFLQNALCRGLGKRPLAFPAGALFPNQVLPQTAIEVMLETGAVYVNHIAPSLYNLTEVRHRLERMVVHLRDPRQALLSWTHFLPQVIAKLDPVQHYHYRLPEDYERLPFAAQLDWQIAHRLPEIVDFIAGWVSAAVDPTLSTRILLSTQEELARDPVVFFNRLLRFYDIPEDAFTHPARPQAGQQNYRGGATTEWQRVFTADQIARATRAIPAELIERFGWPEGSTAIS
jgi:tetratricopeptide (TPR) repeat protein